MILSPITGVETSLVDLWSVSIGAQVGYKSKMGTIAGTVPTFGGLG